MAPRAIELLTPAAGRLAADFVRFAEASNVDVQHLDGSESNSDQENLLWVCRSCSVIFGILLRSAGIGRLTCQFDPAAGARSLGQWITAVQGMKGESSMDPASAIAISRR